MHSGYTLPSSTIDPFELLHQSDGLSEKWRQLVVSSPKRVVAIFNLEPGTRARTRWGDTAEVGAVYTGANGISADLIRHHLTFLTDRTSHRLCAPWIAQSWVVLKLHGTI